MKIRYLGTAAAEGIPAFFCKCPICQEALKLKGRNIRSRSQAIINDDLLLDFGPDSYYHMIKYHIRLDEISNVLITHNHYDHLLASELMYRRKGFASLVKDEIFKVYGSSEVINEVNKYCDSIECKPFIKAIMVNPFEPFMIKNYKIVALKANHDIKSGPYNYLITEGNKTILYAHDTGYFKEETWEYLKENIKEPLSLVSLDCTAGLLNNWADHHLSFDIFLNVIARLKEMNIINEDTKIIANHFSHNGKANYNKMQDVAKEFGVIVSYDGLVVKV